MDLKTALGVAIAALAEKGDRMEAIEEETVSSYDIDQNDAAIVRLTRLKEVL